MFISERDFEGKDVKRCSSDTGSKWLVEQNTQVESKCTCVHIIGVNSPRKSIFVVVGWAEMHRSSRQINQIIMLQDVQQFA